MVNISLLDNTGLSLMIRNGKLFTWCMPLLMQLLLLWTLLFIIISTDRAIAIAHPVSSSSCAATSSSTSTSAATATTSTSSLPPLLQDFFRDTLRVELKKSNIWEQKPLIWRNVAGVNTENLYSFDDAVLGAEGGLLDRASVARTKEASEGKWVSEYAPSTNRKQLQSALERGTVFFNGAGLDYPHLADLAQLSQTTFGLPANINVYITKRGRDVSVCPHTDSQNVLIFQTQGRKRWKVWAPPVRTKGKDPFNRGKNGDRIDEAELQNPPIIDTWLEPGTVLYVPIGFPHATSTKAPDEEEIDGGANDSSKDDENDEVSCHVTLNLDTYFYGLSLVTLRALVAARAPTSSSGASPALDPTLLNDEMHRKLFSPLPLGFLCPDELREDDYRDAYVDHVIEELEAFNRELSEHSGMLNVPEKAQDECDNEAVRECVQFLIKHWRSIMTPTKYANVITPPKRFTPSFLQCKILKDSKNNREYNQSKQLGAFFSAKKSA